MRPKIIAFYLPQFHTIPENDEWWGKDFTDWVSVKKAKPLFPGHYQPKQPAHDYYYNLLDKETMIWQAKLAKKAGIFGFCIYHYWFGNDKQLLEKPAENLLRWQDIDINYCFSWANESWIRSWSKFEGNSWLKTDNKMGDKVYQGRLVKQEYGSESEWKKHFEYLLPFFCDKRYIKKDNKPVFVIYKPENIKKIKPMIQYWNLLALEYGFAGIYFIGTNDWKWKQNGMDAGMLYEPDYSFSKGSRYIIEINRIREILRKVNINIPKIYSYDNIWKEILNRQGREGIYYGGFVDYDDTPRHGTNGTAIKGMVPYKFGKYFGKLYQKALDRGDEYIFLTAWNEWGEGACIEPDSRYGVRCLQEVREILSN